MLETASQAAILVESQLDPGAMHAAALIDLLWAYGGGIPLQRSVSYLRTATGLIDRPGVALVDLSAALLVRAGRYRSTRDVVEAVEMAQRAVALEPGFVPGRFNLALGLDRLGLEHQARTAWAEYLALDSTSGWAEEARAHVAAGKVQAVAVVPRPSGWGSTAEVARYAEAQPTDAMLWGWDVVLGAWGTAVLAGDSSSADRHLSAARTLGSTVERRSGEASLIDAVRVIDSAHNRPPALRALATGHSMYAAARKAYSADDNRAAERDFERAYQAGRRSRPLAAWAAYSRGSPLVYLGRLDAAEASVRRAVARADTTRHPSVAGRARWVLATSLLRQGSYEESLSLARAAAALFARTGEHENVGAVQAVIADAERHVGDPVRTFAAIGDAIATLRSLHPSEWLHNVLYSAGQYAARDSLPRAALRIHDEDVAVATQLNDPVYAAEARIERARVHAAAGNHGAAEADVVAARAIVERLPPAARAWFEADLRLAEARSTLAGDGARARNALDSALAFWRSHQHASRVLPVLVARAEAALSAGDVAGGTADFEAALAQLDGLGSRTESVELRSSLLASARRVADRLVMLKVNGQQPAEALAALERTRVSVGPGRWGQAPVSRIPAHGPAAEVLVSYALIGDTLLAWIVRGESVALVRNTLRRDAFRRTVDRVRASLELGAADPLVMPALASLYDLLIRPLESRLRLPSSVRLAIIPDGEVAGVPFAALRDTARRRYLIEDYSIRFVGSLRDAKREVRRRVAAEPLLIADPAFDPRVFPGLSRLPGARGEVDAVAANYRNARVLSGTAATRAAFEAAAPVSGMVHYAGHALFDDARPERSMLLLAPQADSAPGALTAAELARLDLGGVRLVVLSACETNRPRTGASGFAGLTGALLAAGVQGAVGSLWRVNDQLTRELMIRFHDAYLSPQSGPDALRTAQLAMLTAADARRSSPAAWAGFRFSGS